MTVSRTGRELARVGIAITAALVLVFGALASESDSPGSAPPEILASAKEYAVSKVGEEFFDSYMTLQGSRFIPLKPENLGRWALPDWSRQARYEVVFHLYIPEEPWVSVPCVVNIKQDGSWFSDPNAYEGLPNCVSDPGECECPIDRDAAIAIASEAGLEAGAGSWNTLFHWSGRMDSTYVWSVYNRLSGTAGGKGVVIDANSGEVLGESSWSVTP